MQNFIPILFTDLESNITSDWLGYTNLHIMRGCVTLKFRKLFRITIAVKPIFIDHPGEVIKVFPLQQLVFKCSFYLVDLEGGVVSEQWYLKAVNCLIQMVTNKGLTVRCKDGLVNTVNVNISSYEPKR